VKDMERNKLKIIKRGERGERKPNEPV